jgi:hypothetical protein
VLDSVKQAAKIAATCEPGLDASGQIFSQEFETCCSPGGEQKLARKGGGAIRVQGSLECLFTHPVLRAVDEFGLLTAGLYLRMDSELKVSGEQAFRPCEEQEDCPTGTLKGEIKAEGQIGGIFDVAEGSLLRATLTGRLDGRASIKCQCDDCSATGMIGPPSIVLDIQLTNFLKVRKQWTLDEAKITQFDI